MDTFRRIFGLGPKKQAMPDPVTVFTRDDGTARVRMVPDASPNAALARNALINILGADNVPPGFGMGPVIEVKGKDGAWTPVSGSKGMQPGIETQMGYLQSFQETGIVGPQPVNPDGSMAAQSGGLGETASPQPGASVATQPMLTYGPAPMMPGGGYPFFMGGQTQVPFAVSALETGAEQAPPVKPGKASGGQQPGGPQIPQGAPWLPAIMPLGMPQMPQAGLLQMMPQGVMGMVANAHQFMQVAPTAKFGGGK